MRGLQWYISLPVLLGAVSCTGNSGQMARTPNVLFICVDDLRPELGCYGNEIIHTPNIDRLAKSGAVFTNHFVSVPTCGASRYSLLTGMFPREKGHLGNEAFREFISGKPEAEIPETFIHHLRRNGYYTVGIGKISHYADGLLYGYTDWPGHEYELPHSWDEMLFDPGKWGTGWNAFFGYADGSNRQSKRRQVKPYERAEVDDNGYPDGLTADMAVKKMEELAKRDEPFLMAVGFFKPHLPFNAPGKYWDLYDEKAIPLTPNPFIPENVSRASLHGSGEFNGYELGKERATLEGPVSHDYERLLRHAYYACVSYVDAQVGKLIDQLNRSGLAGNTIVVIWGDHGWHLGDHLIWGKHTLFDRALKSALIVSVPGVTNGRTISRVVSTIDIYPTIMALCGVNMPHATNGQSMVPLLKTRESEQGGSAYSYYNNGISLRTDRYRLTKYFRDQQTVTELYDHAVDPNETINIAHENSELVESLMPLWQKGNTGLFQ